MNNDDIQHDRRKVGKFPVVVLIAIFMQTSAAIWWASAISKTVENQGKTMDIQAEMIKALKQTLENMNASKVLTLEAELARLRAELEARKGNR